MARGQTIIAYQMARSKKGVEAEALSVTENGTYTAPDGKAYTPVTVNVPDTPPTLQIKTVTPTTSQQNVQADEGYDGLEKVVVSAIPEGVAGTPGVQTSVSDHVAAVNGVVANIAGYIPTETKSGPISYIRPSDLGAVVPSGKLNITDTQEKDVSGYASAQVVDANLVAGNIKKDVTILGITGTHEGGTTPTLITKTITQNGTYDPADDNADGYSEVVVNVSGGGGDDGYLRIGGRIFYDTYDDYGDNGATYQFFDANKTEITYTGDIDELEYAVYYKVTGVPRFDRFYVFDNTSHGSGDYEAVDGLVESTVWGMYEILTQYDIWNNDSDFCEKIGSGKALSALALARCEEDDSDQYDFPTIWQYINHCNATRLNGCGDWFILSRGEHNALMDSNLASWYGPSEGLFLWSSVEDDDRYAWGWDSDRQYWNTYGKYRYYSCFAARAF